MLLASAERKKFSRHLWAGKLDSLTKDKVSDFDIISFSGKNELEEQALSIASYLFHVGLPQKWTIYSDGSHTQNDIDCLEKLFPFVKVKPWNQNPSLAENQLLNNYLKTCHLSKKLHAILGHRYERQTIYTDSDIVFYKNASAYFNSCILNDHFWFLPETNWGSLKNENLSEAADMFVLNSGLLILNHTFDFNHVFTYLESLNNNFHYFSEQSAFNYSFKKQKACVLDPRKFIVDTEDQFDFGMSFEADEMAVRHFVNPVRHKMWQKGWKWHFKDQHGN
jgi:hypothetical protein